MVVEYLGPAFKLHRSLGQFEILALWAGLHPASEWILLLWSLRLLPWHMKQHELLCHMFALSASFVLVPTGIFL